MLSEPPMYVKALLSRLQSSPRAGTRPLSQHPYRLEQKSPLCLPQRRSHSTKSSNRTTAKYYIKPFLILSKPLIHVKALVSGLRSCPRAGTCPLLQHPYCPKQKKIHCACQRVCHMQHSALHRRTAMYRRTIRYWIAFGPKTSVYTGTRSYGRSIIGQNENLKQRSSFCRQCLS